MRISFRKKAPEKTVFTVPSSAFALRYKFRLLPVYSYPTGNFFVYRLLPRASALARAASLLLSSPVH
jgi:hypothetical protein